MTDKSGTEKITTTVQPAEELEKITSADTITPAQEEIEDFTEKVKNGTDFSEEQRAKIAQYYGNKAKNDKIAPATDITYILDQIVSMSEDRAVEILLGAIQYHADDPNFPGETMRKIKVLVQGSKVAELEPADYDFDLKAEAAIIHYHSPYPEVRSVTDPFDDPDAPVETFRAYALGLMLMAGCTAINTFFAPRQPTIQIASIVLQLVVYPCGKFWAKVVPDWGVTVRGKRYSINHGPWTFKEQMFSTIIFSVANQAGATY